MAEDDNIIYYERLLDLIRRKIFEKVSDMEEKAKLLALVGEISGDKKDFVLLLDLIEKTNFSELREFACKKLASAGLFNEARSISKLIINPEVAFDALIDIALKSKDGQDFSPIPLKIDELKKYVENHVLSEKKVKHEINQARRTFVKTLLKAGKYKWAEIEIKKIEYGEHLYGNMVSAIIESSYESKIDRKTIIDKRMTDDLQYAFQYALKYGTVEEAIVIIYLLLEAGKIEEGIKLVENINEELPDANYIKARSFIVLANKIQNEKDYEEYLEKAIDNTMRITEMGTDHTLKLLTDISIGTMNPYYLSLACDIAINNVHKEDKLWDIAYILNQITKLKKAS